MENFEEFDVGNVDELVAEALQEIAADGYDCASVDLLMRLSKDGDLDSVAGVLGGLASAGHPEWAGEILRMTMWSGAPEAEPDYTTAAAVLTYLVDIDVELAHKICPHMLVYQEQGPDCYDFALTIGFMVKSRKVSQAGKVLLAMYSDETQEGQNYKSLVPCLLGTLIDFQHLDWALALIQYMCTGAGRDQPDYAAAGWCLAQHVFFGRPDWASGICRGLGGQRSGWYNQGSMMQSVATWGGDGYAQQILNHMGNGMHGPAR